METWRCGAVSMVMMGIDRNPHPALWTTDAPTRSEGGMNLARSGKDLLPRTLGTIRLRRSAAT